MRKAIRLSECANADIPGGVVVHYRLAPPLDGHEYVIASAIPAAFDHGAPETFVFPADASGTITLWGELPGSYRGGMDHDLAIRDAGYTVVTEDVS